MIRILSGFLAFSMFLTFGLGSAPEALAAQKAPPARASLLKTALEGSRSAEGLGVFLAGSGIPQADAKHITADFRSRLGNGPLPKLSLKNNEITVNGEATGIWVDPSGPSRVRFQGRTWRYDANSTPEKNYFSLVKFLSPAPETTLLDYLIPSAHATSKGQKWGAAAGAGVTIVAGIAATVIIALGGPEIVVGLLGMVALNAIINVGAGAMIGDSISDRGVIHKALDKAMFAAKIEVSCTHQEALIRITTAEGEKITIEFTQSMEQKDGGHEYARILDEKDGHVKNVSGMKVDNELYARMMKCTDDATAAKIAEGLKNAIAKALQTDDAPAPGETPVPEAPQTEKANTPAQ